MRQTQSLLLSSLFIATAAPAALDFSDRVKSVDVYPYPVVGGLSVSPAGPASHRFCGWPANGKMFAWGDELLLVFSYAEAATVDGEKYHAVGEGEGFRWSVRSFDGGLTWTDTPENGAGHVAPHEALPLTTPIDFSHPDLALMIQMTHSRHGPARILYSYDRGRSWKGFYELDAPGFDPVAARSDCLIEGPETIRLFSTAAHAGEADQEEEGEGENRTIYQWMSRDGGMSWQFKGRTGLDVIHDPAWSWSAMPATVQLSSGRMVQVARTKGSGRPYRNYHPVYASDDSGETWKLVGEVFKEVDGRSGKGYFTPSDLDLIPGTDTIVCTYVERTTPSRILAKMSSDGGVSWGDEIVLRADGGGHDVGYPETVFNARGEAVTVAYWFLKNDPKAWSDRHDPRFLAFVIWDPSDVLHASTPHTPKVAP